MESTSLMHDTVKYAVAARHRLVLVVGASGSGKTAVLRDIAKAKGMPCLSLGQQLGPRLLDAPPRSRPLQVEDGIRELIGDAPQGICIDNTDILFDPTLKCDPLRLALSISQNTLVVFSLTGKVDGKRFVRGDSDHPEFYSEELPAVPIFTVDHGIPSLQAS